MNFSVPALENNLFGHTLECACKMYFVSKQNWNIPNNQIKLKKNQHERRLAESESIKIKCWYQGLLLNILLNSLDTLAHKPFDI